MNFKPLENQPRLLLKATLRPLQGSRFQPTGFPDLGAATYDCPQGRKMLLVESAQSMANRFEAVCWDTTENNWVQPLQGLPAVLVNDKAGNPLTNSVLEAHRLNSPYITNAKGFDEIKAMIAFDDKRPFNREPLLKSLLKYDVNALLHGVFLEKIAGVIRLPRALTGFIEATDVKTVASGGVKNDRVRAAKGDEGQTAKEGFGNIPFPRDEYCGHITAFFNLDLALIHGFGLGPDAEALLIALSLFKIQRFLRDGLRLRTACDLEIDGALIVQRPGDFVVPSLKELEDALPALIAKAYAKTDGKDRFTTVTYDEAKKKATSLQLSTGPTIPKELENIVKWKKATKKKPASLEISSENEVSAEELAQQLYPGDDKTNARTAFLKAWQAASSQGDADEDESADDPNQEQK
jgi:CRISPR-associated protein Csb1